MGPGVNLRPSLYFLKYMINPRPLNGTSFYPEEASIRENTFFMYVIFRHGILLIYVFCSDVFDLILVMVILRSQVLTNKIEFSIVF